FIDEIHRFNKGQQDTILPYVEDGTVTLIGATTENPSFEVVTPLLSRACTFVLKELQPGEVKVIVARALSDKERGLGNMKIDLSADGLDPIANLSNGDARVALNILELAAMASPPDGEGVRHLSLAAIEDAAQKKFPPYDKAGEQHYDIISALHKSL